MGGMSTVNMSQYKGPSSSGTRHGGGRGSVVVPVNEQAKQISQQRANPSPAPAPAPAQAQLSPYDQFMQGGYKNWMAPEADIQKAFQQMLPMYQARLGGLQGPVAEAMRNRGLETIQNQYGSALRSAMNQAAAQGVRGPAAVAMQQDIRDQMGRATAGFQRDLTIADWDAKRQALADYYGFAGGERGTAIGTIMGGQQLDNIAKGYAAQQAGFNQMQQMNQGTGPQLPYPGFLPQAFNPNNIISGKSNPLTSWAG